MVLVDAPAVSELWTPETDRGVLIQLIATLALFGSLIWLVRRERALVLLVAGVGTMVLAWYGLRTLH